MKYRFEPLLEGEAVRFALPVDAIVSSTWLTSDGQLYRPYTCVPETLAPNADWIRFVPAEVRQQGGRLTLTIVAEFQAEASKARHAAMVEQVERLTARSAA